MRILDAAAVAAALPDGPLIEALAAAFRTGATVPLRHHHALEGLGAETGTLLLMPAWLGGPEGVIGVKLVTVTPDNGARGQPAVAGLYALFDGPTGRPLAVLDGTMLTLRRTAAASALAADHLARADAATLLMVGTGALAPHLVRAHAGRRPYRRILVWGRHAGRAAALAERLAAEGLPAQPAADLAGAVAAADVISCATLSQAPLIRGASLRPGTHLDLVGAFTPAMREADDEAVSRACLFVDTRAGALAEGGDLAAPLAAGLISPDDIRADLADLAAGRHPGRRTELEITLFKSVGTALEDLAAARLALARAA